MTTIAITSCRKLEDYKQAVLHVGGDVRVVDATIGVDAALDGADGVMLTGGDDVEPSRYGEAAHTATVPAEEGRDEFELALVRAARDRRLPIFAICRGVQVMNVAFGGTLVQKLHEVPGNLDHRDDERAPLEVQYADVHDVNLAPGSVLRRLAGADRVRVNSLHSQGIERLGERLVVEARAPDGVIEAFRVEDAPRFALAVQWHPEWQVTSNSLSRALFAAFGAASRERAQDQVQHGE